MKHQYLIEQKSIDIVSGKFKDEKASIGHKLPVSYQVAQ